MKKEYHEARRSFAAALSEDQARLTAMAT